MATRAKMVCTTKTQRQGSICVDGQWIQHPLWDVQFMPVGGNNPENAKFYAATPGGRLEFNGLRDEVAHQFEVGKEYFITCELA